MVCGQARSGQVTLLHYHDRSGQAPRRAGEESVQSGVQLSPPVVTTIRIIHCTWPVRAYE